MVAIQNYDLSFDQIHLDPVRKLVIFRVQLSQPGLLATAHNLQMCTLKGVVAAGNCLHSREVVGFGSFANPVHHRSDRAIGLVHSINSAFFEEKLDWNRLRLQV